MKKTQCGILSLLFLMLLFSGCGTSTAPNESMGAYDSDNSYVDGYYEDSYETMEEESISGEQTTVESKQVDTNRKLIKTVELSVETQEFSKCSQFIEDKTVEYGGYVEQLYTYNGSVYDSDYSYKNASYTLRIPKDKLEQFLSEVGNVGNVISRTERVDDVTLTYVDLESRKKVLLAEEERLMSFLQDAQTIEEIISIESRLSEVRYQIESMESQLRTFDNQIDYSTVHLDLTEVAVLSHLEDEEATTWERMSVGFLNSLESLGYNLKELCVSFVIGLPYILFILMIILLIVGIVLGGVKLGMKASQKSQKTNIKK